MKFNIDKQKYIDSKLVDEKEHPTFPLLIYNYTPECQFSKTWDEVTLMCRGLVVHKETREIIARPFLKFFNYEEHILTQKLPTEIPTVYPKLDGSLGILYWWDNEPYIATRGSFTSDQALWATEFIHRPDVRQWVNKLDKSQTHLFEIIFPENRIVVSYGDRRDLIHLASVDIKTGKSFAPDSDFPMASSSTFTSYEELKARNIPNEEGYVLHYPGIDLRLKIKFEDYIKLHKVITGLSQIGVWEMLKDGKNIMQIIQDIPDEMHEWVNQIASGLLEKFVTIENVATIAEIEAKKYDTRKEQAKVVVATQHPGIAFSMLDGKDYKTQIWRLIRPKGIVTFRRDIDA